MTTFYSMCGKNSRKSAVARADPTIKSRELLGLIKQVENPTQWPGLHLSLGDGELTDLPPTNLIGRVCSPKLVSVVDAFNADLMWLPVHLHGDGKEWVYQYMHFTTVPDVLDENKTIYVDGSVFAPHLSWAKAGDMPLFCLRPQGLLAFVRQDVRTAIESAKCVGIEFEKVPCS